MYKNQIMFVILLFLFQIRVGCDEESTQRNAGTVNVSGGGICKVRRQGGIRECGVIA